MIGGHLINKAKYRKGKAVVYSLRIRDRLNTEAFKIGYSSDFSSRLSYYPDRLDIDILNVKILPKKEAKAFEAFIHKNNNDKYIWKGRRFDGFTELYTEEVELKDWYLYFKHGLPNLDTENNEDDLDSFLSE